MIKFLVYTFVAIAQLSPQISCKHRFSEMFSDKSQIPGPDQIMMKIMDVTNEKIISKYNAFPIGFGMKGPDKFQRVSIEFQIHKELDKDEARAILLDCAEIFLNEINNNLDIRPHLKVYPFKNENVGITLYISKNQNKTFHPYVCVASWRGKEIYFRTNDPDKKYGYKETTEETHEEALELVRQYRAAQIAQSIER